jgi:hypothetical protein
MNLRKIAAGAAMVGALGFGAVGLSAGTANAAPAAPVTTGWEQDHGGYWDHDGDGGWGHRGDWDNRDWNNGPRWGCFTGPFGHITWCP